MEKNKIIFYTTPAHGHINPAMHIVSSLTKEGYDIIAYSTEEFRNLIEGSGAEFRLYNTGSIRFDTSVGNELLIMTKLILQFTNHALPALLADADAEQPILVMHDTLALWGKMTADILGIPAVSVNTFITSYSMKSRAFRMYSKNFALSTALQFYALHDIKKELRILKRNYGLEKTDMMSLLMNREKLNIFTYPRCMHPDGDTLGKDCFFPGNPSRLRPLKKGDTLNSDKLIYVSLGTVFNKSLSFYRELFRDFSKAEFDLLVSCGKNLKRISLLPHAENIVLTSFSNQNEVLKQAKLFITAGGMNSLCEAAAAGVPCLIVPQQGEQKISAFMAEKCGLGKISHGRLFKESCDTIDNFKRNEETISEFSAVKMNELILLLKTYMKGDIT